MPIRNVSIHRIFTNNFEFLQFKIICDLKSKFYSSLEHFGFDWKLFKSKISLVKLPFFVFLHIFLNFKRFASLCLFEIPWLSHIYVEKWKFFRKNGNFSRKSYFTWFCCHVVWTTQGENEHYYKFKSIEKYGKNWQKYIK